MKTNLHLHRGLLAFRQITPIPAILIAMIMGAIGFSAKAHARNKITFSDPGFVAETVAALPRYTPIGLTFASDGRIFIWQKSGEVQIVKDGALLSTPFLHTQSRVNQCVIVVSWDALSPRPLETMDTFIFCML